MRDYRNDLGCLGDWVLATLALTLTLNLVNLRFCQASFYPAIHCYFINGLQCFKVIVNGLWPRNSTLVHFSLHSCIPSVSFNRCLHPCPLSNALCAHSLRTSDSCSVFTIFILAMTLSLVPRCHLPFQHMWGFETVIAETNAAFLLPIFSYIYILKLLLRTY